MQGKAEQQAAPAIADIKRGDIAGLERLVQLYQLPALRAAYAVTGDHQAAEDIVADAFLVVYDRIAQYDERRAFAPWFFRIVVNASLKVAQRTSRTTGWDSVAEGEQEHWRHQPSSDPEEAAISHETRSVVGAAIRLLPPRQRAVLVLRYYLDMEEAAIATTLGCPLGTVKWRLHAARERLRRSLADMEQSQEKGEKEQQAERKQKPALAPAIVERKDEQL